MLSSRLSTNQSNPPCFFECVVPAATLVPIIRSPFDFLAEGLVSKNSRGDRTAIELFLRFCAGIKGCGLEVMKLA
jgi:hypothetical protein